MTTGAYDGSVRVRSRRPLVVVSNREPYLHSYANDRSIIWAPTTGGVAVALDALMRERGGVWIAHGAGEADRATVGSDDRVIVPPDSPTYPLRRIWLTEEEEAHYYEGFANEGLWPLCHDTHIRPVFRAADWKTYQTINERFAAAIDEELPDLSAPVFIQDYHLALVAASLRARRPGVRTALFWHIPWPQPDHLRICPWRKEIVTGLLANDLLAFQLDRDRRNFLAAARDELEAEVGRSTVRFRDRTTTVYAVPIGVDYDRIQEMASDPALDVEMSRLRVELQIDTPLIGIGVDRLDYTKGIPERMEALDLLFTRRPDLREKLTFVQIGVPSRSKIDSYAAVEAAIDQKVAEINARYDPGRQKAKDGTSPEAHPPIRGSRYPLLVKSAELVGWALGELEREIAQARGRPRARPRAASGPIRYRKSALKIRRLVALYRMANFCIVSSLHDGMNLVAKEFVAAREDLDAVLVLSERAGAAQELRDAVIINPYDVDGFADALEYALEMSQPERHRRMGALRRVVAGRNVFSWASDILEGLENLEPTSFPAALGQVRPAPRDRGHAGVASPGIPPPTRVKPSR